MELGHSDTEARVAEVGGQCSKLPATWSWWAVRALATQQRTLSGLSSSLRAALSALIPLVPPPPVAPLSTPHYRALLPSCTLA